MSEKRHSVAQWQKATLQAASMSVGVCEGSSLVGVDLRAQDGAVFAHGHLDADTAERFWRCLGEAIVEARQGKAASNG